MKIPRKLKIGAQSYRVLLVDPEDIEGSCGEQYASRNIIKISKDLPETQLIVALFHEILHALNTELKHEEVEFLAQGITQVLVDNKLFRY